jgi:hypothetical protein
MHSSKTINSDIPRKLLCTVELFHSYAARTRRDSLIDQHLGYRALGGMFRHRHDRHIKNSLSNLDKIGMPGSTITNFIILRVSRERCCATQGPECELPPKRAGTEALMRFSTDEHCPPNKGVSDICIFELAPNDEYYSRIKIK